MVQGIRFHSFAPCLAVLAFAFGFGIPGGAAAAEPAAAESLIRRYVDAFNRHDVDATVACVDTAFRWYSVAGDSMRLTMEGRETQRAGLTRYFASFKDVHSDIDGLTVNGAFVSVRERVRWSGANGLRENVALAVYELGDGLIRRVWYFPVVRPTPAPAGGAGGR
jgi:hypothetical protein